MLRHDLSNLFWEWWLYWDGLNIIQLQARPGISSCLLIQPPPPDDFLQHTFGFNRKHFLFWKHRKYYWPGSLMFWCMIICVENPLLIQSPHAGKFSQFSHFDGNVNDFCIFPWLELLSLSLFTFTFFIFQFVVSWVTFFCFHSQIHF